MVSIHSKKNDQAITTKLHTAPYFLEVLRHRPQSTQEPQLLNKGTTLKQHRTYCLPKMVPSRCTDAPQLALTPVPLQLDVRRERRNFMLGKGRDSDVKILVISPPQGLKLGESSSASCVAFTWEGRPHIF